MSLNETNIDMPFDSLSTSERKGAIVVVVFALLSTLAFALIAFRTIRLAALLFHGGDTSKSRPSEILFFRTQLGHYAGCLLLSNIFISTAGLIDFSWASRSGLSQGLTCSAQGVLMQIGIWGTCWFTAAHGIHTLCSLGFHKRPPRWRSTMGVAVGWVIALVAGLAPLRMNDAYGPAGISCGISPSHPTDIFVLEALPIFLGAFVSTVTYLAIFIIMHGKLNLPNTQKLGGPSAISQHGEDRSEGYYKFICVIIRSMFWFPFAFVLLCFPFCITRTLMSAGSVVPAAVSVFADVCISMLGLANVGLLCNTLRVIAPVYLGPPAGVTESVKTFGNNASSESPTSPQSKPRWQPTLHEHSYPTYNSTRLPSDHSRDSSWASVNSNTRLLGAEKVPYRFAQTKKVSPLTNNGAKQGPWTRERYFSFHPMADDERVSTLEASPWPLSLSSPEIRSKSATLATRLGISIVVSDTTSQAPPTNFAQELEREQGMVSAIPATPIHQFEEVVIKSPTKADVSPCFSASTMASSVNSDSDYFGEVMHIRRTRPLSQIPEPSDEEWDFIDSHSYAPQRLSTRSCRTSMTTIWSQETGYTLTLPTERGEVHQQLTGNALVPRVILGDDADVGGVNKPAVALSKSWRTSHSKPLLRPNNLNPVSSMSRF